MDYKFKIESFRKVFFVPCDVVEKYIKLAPENAVKVLLYILCSNNDTFTSEEITKATDILPIEIDDAVLFWENYNILKSDKDNNKIDNNNSNVEKSEEKEYDEKPCVKSIVRYSSKDIGNIVNNSNDLKYLMDNIQQIVKRTITYNEQNSIINLYEYYHFPVQVIIMLFEYCESIGKTKNFQYAESVAKSWSENDIMTHEQVEAEIIKMIDRHTLENQIKSSFGINVNLTPTQKKYITDWNSAGFSLDMINYAYEKCVDSLNKISFPYINKVLESWNNKNYKTKEQVIAEEKNPNTKYQKQETPSYDLNEIFNKSFFNSNDNKGE